MQFHVLKVDLHEKIEYKQNVCLRNESVLFLKYQSHICHFFKGVRDEHRMKECIADGLGYI